MRKKKGLAVFCAALMLTVASIGILPQDVAQDYLFSVSATEATSGECGADGDNLTWTFDRGTLTISGEGEMMEALDYPWSGFKYEIYHLVIQDGVTSIGGLAFSYCLGLTSITIPDSVTSIGSSAFNDTPWLAAERKENPLVIVNGILFDGSTCETCK